MYLGWFCPPTKVKVNHNYVPFEKCKEGMTDVPDDFYELATKEP